MTGHDITKQAFAANTPSPVAVVASPVHSKVHPGSPAELLPERLEAAKVAFTCRRVPPEQMRSLISDRKPRAGDLVLARVVRRRQHGRIELPTGRKAELFSGDEIVVCYGNRYASDQFEALVPEDLGPCHLVASGGVAGLVVARHRGVRPATEIEPIGLIGDASGEPLNLRQFAIDAGPESLRSPFCIGVIGSSMNAGKTTSAAHLVRAFRQAGYRVGAAKVTGTGSGGDYWKLLDAGAASVLDFTDAGHVSTYRAPVSELCEIAATLTTRLGQDGAEVIILEIADGVFQHETAELIQSSLFRRLIDGYFLAVADSLSAAAGVDWMRARSLPLFGLCGVLSRSPLAVREAVVATSVPVLSLGELGDPDIATNLKAAGAAQSSATAESLAQGA